MSSEIKAFVYVLMGVSGTGKSTVGEALARHLDCPFYDADDFHSPENIAKMAGGAPLTDDDRWPWHAQLAEIVAQHIDRGEMAVLACSALKESYRTYLRGNSERVVFIYLRGSFDLILGRMQDREDHFMQAAMLQSQFDDLEEPSLEDAI